MSFKKNTENVFTAKITPTPFIQLFTTQLKIEIQINIEKHPEESKPDFPNPISFVRNPNRFRSLLFNFHPKLTPDESNLVRVVLAQ